MSTHVGILNSLCWIVLLSYLPCLENVYLRIFKKKISPSNHRIDHLVDTF